MNQNAKKLNLQILNKLEDTISKGDIDSFKKLSNSIDCTGGIHNQILLTNYYDNTNNVFKKTNLVILACKYNKLKILKHIFDNNTKALNNSSTGIETTISPYDEDEACHNAFYYAIRSGNIELLDTLINKWPDNYFANHLNELDEILSKTYEELKLRNVLLSDEVEIFVENKLINLRFFSKTFDTDQSVTININNVRERIELVIYNINLLKTEYSNTKKVDYKFLFLLKFIAQNIYILKRQLKSTYDRLPWEEIEFCLVTFVSCHIKPDEINLFVFATLSKDKILNHLRNFAMKLENEKDIEDKNIGKFVDLAKLKREKVIEEIISNCPDFEQLYTDYQEIRDIHSLLKISVHAKLALSADPNQREGQLIITRVLQVIGEYLKNTLESPKLSNTTSDLFVLKLSNNTRKIIIDLRNSLSHAYSLSERTEIEENKNIDFFIGVQKDTKKIADVINDILYNKRIKVTRKLLKKITESQSSDEIKEVSEILHIVRWDKMISDNLKTTEQTKLEKLLKEFSDSITDKTSYEMQLFDKINNIINSSKVKSESSKKNYIIGFSLLKCISITVSNNNNNINHNIIRGLKYYANQALENIAPETESLNLKEILKLSSNIASSIMSRMQGDSFHNIDILICEMFYIAELETDEIKWIEKLRKKLKENNYFNLSSKRNMTCNVTREMYNNQLSLKLSELKNTLKINALSGRLIKKLPLYRTNKNLQAVIEMLVLDIMSILGCSGNYLENNELFLDDNTPLLTGKCLRNHLAHDNALVNVLLSDPSISIILNAKKLTSENIIETKKKLGKLVIDSPSKLKDKYDQSLSIINNQESMFIALEEGNLEDFKNYLEKGADIHARSINLWTTLHFAAKGPNLESIKFILQQNLDVNAKDINGQSSLHIAATYGRANIVEHFLKETHARVNDKDNYKKTPLHIAAKNGHIDTVKILLKNGASTNVLDISYYLPLYFAVINNHIDIVKILLDKQNINEAFGNFTPLHLAAENGHLEVVNFLLKNEANINVTNDDGTVPLHLAALNGHVEVVKVLILMGANVNSSVIDGRTSLHYAIENNHEEVANILLEHGANANATEKMYNNTPLHYAAKNGHNGIVKALLKNKANSQIATVEGLTPLDVAVLDGHLKVVETFFEDAADICYKGKTSSALLHYAARSGCKEIAEFLITNGAKVNAKDKNNLTPLYLAVCYGHKDIINLLLKNRAKISIKDIKGNTLLHEATQQNHDKDIIELLIRYEAEVNARTNDGITPLHIAAANGNKDVVELLIQNKATVNAKSNQGLTPLHTAITEGHKDIVEFLIKNNARINWEDMNITPLHAALQADQKEIVKVLIDNGANVNAKSKHFSTPLLSAVKCNNKEIIEILIASGANVNVGGRCEALDLAIFAGYKDIVRTLLKNNAYVNTRNSTNLTPLHSAAKRGHEEIVKELIAAGANIDAVTNDNMTPLFCAAFEGHEEVTEILIANGANVNVKVYEGYTPLHIAAINGHNNVVKILLNNNANPKARAKVKDNEVIMPLELAVLNDRLEVIKTLVQHKDIDINARSNQYLTILHVASERSNLEMIKFLVDAGADINAKNPANSRPIHIAAREGHPDTIEFFLSKGSSINDLGSVNQTLVHYAAMKGQVNVLKYLLGKGADINAQDDNGSTPMHIAAYCGSTDAIKFLLDNGAAYNILDNNYLKPLEIAYDKSTIKLLLLTEKLFEAVKCNSTSEVQQYIKAGAFINAKNTNTVTPLHYAAWKGYNEIVDILLQNKANLNAVNNKGLTPLHYAAKFSHLQIVKVLLSNGAIYNATSEGGKTPLDFTVDKSIMHLFNLLNVLFRNIKHDNSKVINELNKINDAGILKAMMNACNEENRTLVTAAMYNNFSKIEELKAISQGDIVARINMALELAVQGDYQRALWILKNAYEKRKEILGPDNPGTLDIQVNLAKVLYKQGVYQEAINMFEDILQKQVRILGLNHKDTLNTRGGMALVLYRQGKLDKASNIFQEVYQKQKEILGLNHTDTLITQFHMAMVLNSQGKFEEALNMNKAVYENRKKTLGIYNPATISAQNNVAMVLANLKEYEKALPIYEEVFEMKKEILGINHADTLRTLCCMGQLLSNQKKYPEALKTFQKCLNIQQNVLGPNNPETLNTLYELGNLYFIQGKCIAAYKTYRKCLDQRIAIFGSDHPSVLDISRKLEVMNLRFQFEGSNSLEMFDYLLNKINVAASDGDTQTIQSLLKDGVDINDKDNDGRTALHYSVSNGQTDAVNILLKNGADIMQITNKGNTVLHIATSKNYKEIVKILLQHVGRDKLNSFVNAKTNSSGVTSLHVAVKNGFLEIVKSLLKHGATYNIENKEGKKPLDLSKNQSVSCLLKLIEELFQDAKRGNIEIINKLRAVKPDEFLVATNARDNQGNTLLQATIVHQHKKITIELLEMIKKQRQFSN